MSFYTLKAFSPSRISIPCSSQYDPQFSHRFYLFSSFHFPLSQPLSNLVKQKTCKWTHSREMNFFFSSFTLSELQNIFLGGNLKISFSLVHLKVNFVFSCPLSHPSVYLCALQQYKCDYDRSNRPLTRNFQFRFFSRQNSTVTCKFSSFVYIQVKMCLA